MADSSLGPGKYVVPVILEGFALAFAFHSADSFLDGKTWVHSWGAAALTIVLSFAGFKWPSIKSIYANRNPWRQLKAARSRIEELSRLIPPPSKLKIHSASWGSSGSRKPVLEALERQPKDALVIGISNEVLGCDPAWGNDNKYIEVEYSYGDGPMLRAKRMQGRLLVLPEDKQFIEDTAAECERKRQADVYAVETQLKEERAVSQSNRDQIGEYMRELQKLEEEKVELTRTHTEEMAKLRAKFELTKPVIVPMEFGQQDRPERNARWPGLVLCNDGKEVAYEIDIVPFTIGKWHVNFEPVLRSGVGEKTATWVNVWWENTGNADLREHIIDWQKANGALGNPVPFRIEYRDSLENWFVSECEFKLNVLNRSSGLDVKFVRRVQVVP